MNANFGAHNRDWIIIPSDFESLGTASGLRDRLMMIALTQSACNLMVNSFIVYPDYRMIYMAGSNG
jgi:hypothetical protein